MSKNGPGFRTRVLKRPRQTTFLKAWQFTCMASKPAGVSRRPCSKVDRSTVQITNRNGEALRAPRIWTIVTGLDGQSWVDFRSMPGRFENQTTPFPPKKNNSQSSLSKHGTGLRDQTGSNTPTPVADGRQPQFLTKMVVVGRLCYGGSLLGPV